MNIAGIALILAGYGVWGLVAQIVVEKLVGFLLLLRVGHWRPGLSVSRHDIRPLLPDFLSIAGAQLLSHGARNLDRLAVGILFPPAITGAYILACRVVETATTLLLQGANKVVYVLFSRLQGESEQLHGALNRASEVTAMVAVPAFAGLSVLASDVVIMLFGRQWADTGTLLQVLILAGIVMSILGVDARSMSGLLVMAGIFGFGGSDRKSVV